MNRPHADRLRAAVQAAIGPDRSRWRIARDAGMGLTNLCRFLDGESGITLDLGLRLAEVVGCRFDVTRVSCQPITKRVEPITENVESVAGQSQPITVPRDQPITVGVEPITIKSDNATTQRVEPITRRGDQPRSHARDMVAIEAGPKPARSPRDGAQKYDPDFPPPGWNPDTWARRCQRYHATGQ